MIPSDKLHTSFNAGELSPYLRGQISLDKYGSGLQELTNFIALPQGGVTYRTGTKKVTTSPYPVDPDTNKPYPVLLVGFSPNTTNGYIVEIGHLYLRILWDNGPLTIVNDDTGFEVPYFIPPWRSTDLEDLSVTYSVDEVIFCHPSYPPYILRRFSHTRYSFKPLDFKIQPFGERDNSGASITLSNEKRIFKIVSSDSEEFNNIPSGVEWLEWKEDGKWYLGRILDLNSSPPAPDPGDGVCYVEPVRSVSGPLPPNATFGYADSSVAPELTGGEYIISDSAVFSSDLEGAWIRFNPSFQGLLLPQEDGRLWVKGEQYVGQEDVATVYLDTPDHGDMTVGHTYKIISGNMVFHVSMASRNDQPHVKNEHTGFVYSAVGDTFQWANFAEITSGSGVIADLNSNHTVDVLKISSKLDDSVIYSPLAPLTVDRTGREWTATVTFSAPMLGRASGDFEEDAGRFIKAKYTESWVFMQILEATSETKAKVKILSSVPYDPKDDSIADNGVSGEFHLSAWYTGNYPYCAVYHEQRLVFGGSPSNPQTVWFSSSTDPFDFSTHEEDGSVLDTSGMSYRISSRQLSRIRWMDTGPVLLIASESGVFQVRAGSFGAAITPSNIRITQESQVGSSKYAIRVGSSVFFANRTGTQFYELRYNFQIESYEAVDVTIMANHLFKEDPIVGFDYQSTPQSVLWVVTRSGLLYGLTYVRDQDVYAWHRHKTGLNESFESVAVRYGTRESNDEVWVSVRRLSGDSFIEKFSPEFTDPGVDNFKPNLSFADCHVRYPDTGYLEDPITEINASVNPLHPDLFDYNGREVVLVIDGAVVEGPIVIENSRLTLPYTAYKYVLIGYPYVGRLVTLPASQELPTGSAYAQPKRIEKAGFYVYKSIGMSVAALGREPNSYILGFHKTDSVTNESPSLFTGFVPPKQIDDDHGLDGQLIVEQTQPYPLTVLSAVISFKSYPSPQ